MDNREAKFLRELAAVAALGGIMANPAFANRPPERIGEDAVRAADALMAALNKDKA